MDVHHRPGIALGSYLTYRTWPPPIVTSMHACVICMSNLKHGPPQFPRVEACTRLNMSLCEYDSA